MAGFRNAALMIGCLLAVVDVTNADDDDKNSINFLVGSAVGWTTPTGGETFYKVWASTRSFYVGDTIVFNWQGSHDVAEVSEQDYRNCNKSSPIGTVQTTSPYSLVLKTAGWHYFICTVEDHCSQGQKISIKVSVASSLAIGAFSLFSSAIVFVFLDHLS